MVASLFLKTTVSPAFAMTGFGLYAPFPTELTMLTVTVDGVGAGVGVGVGAAADGEPLPPPQLKKRSAPAIATPVPERRDVFMRRYSATRIPGPNPVVTITCVILDYRTGKTFRRSSGCRTAS